MKNIFEKKNPPNPLKDLLIRGDEKLLKPFSYNKNDVHLAFQLNIKDKQELKDFKSCLEGALEDVEKCIKIK